jgi:WD40 repeat protein
VGGIAAYFRDAEGGQELLTLRGHANDVLGVASSPDGKLLATAGSDEAVQVYALDVRELLNLLGVESHATSLPTNVNDTSSPRPCPPLP